MTLSFGRDRRRELRSVPAARSSQPEAIMSASSASSLDALFDLSTFTPPVWMRRFVRNELRPLFRMERARQRALEALDRMTVRWAEEDKRSARRWNSTVQRMKWVNRQPQESRQAKETAVLRILNARPSSLNPLELLTGGLFPSFIRMRDHDVSLYEIWVALMSVHDVTRVPHERIGPLKHDYYRPKSSKPFDPTIVLSDAERKKWRYRLWCVMVRDLREEHLLELRDWATVARQSLEPPLKPTDSGQVRDANKANRKASSSPPKQPARIGRLLAALTNPKNKGKSKTEIALQVAEDDERRAKSLLSQHRRYERQMEQWRTQSEQS